MGVWIETSLLENYTKLVQSHPVWVCGLKPVLYQSIFGDDESHPVWVCGLKLL